MTTNIEKYRLSRFFTPADIAAITTWAIIVGITFYILPYDSEKIQGRLWMYISLFLLYLVSFLIATRDEKDFLIPYRYRITFLFVQIGAAFGLLFLLPVDYLPILSIIWAAVLPAFFRFKTSLLLITIVVLLWFSLQSYLQDESLFLQGLLYTTFHVFALMAHHQTIQATRAKEALEQKNAELIATRHLLAEANKQAERTRIARDLHDLLGHHLTALTINLQVASHLTEGDAKEKVDQCHQLSKLLLNDVRDAVSTLRDNQELELISALKALTEYAPGLEVKLALPAKLTVESLPVAETILRCVQEALTNTLKHSGATEMTITLSQQHNTLTLVIEDNGQVKKDWQLGNGLKGMQERVANVGGTLNISKQSTHLCYVIELSDSILSSKQGAA